MSFQSSDSINLDDTSTKTISADNRANKADNEAVVNIGHAAEHIVKEASDNFNAIQNANLILTWCEQIILCTHSKR